MNSASQFDCDGFQILPALLSLEACDEIVRELAENFQTRDRTRRRGGVRNVFQYSATALTFAKSAPVMSLVSALIGAPAFPVRAILFDKTPEANWGVPWHQDLAIAVAQKIDTPGFNAWSVKEGVIHVNPPIAVLEGMVTLRLHLDDCNADNGALRVLPGSHRDGELNGEAISNWSDRQTAVMCEVPKGGALFMRPLLLHASAAALRPMHRRVLHVEYAATDLPNGLKWSERA